MPLKIIALTLNNHSSIPAILRSAILLANGYTFFPSRRSFETEATHLAAAVKAFEAGETGATIHQPSNQFPFPEKQYFQLRKRYV